jgi:hypothetical protein
MIKPEEARVIAEPQDQPSRSIVRSVTSCSPDAAALPRCPGFLTLIQSRDGPDWYGAAKARERISRRDPKARKIGVC